VCVPGFLPEKVCSKACFLAAPCQHLRSHARRSELLGTLQAADRGLVIACLRWQL